MNLLELQVLAVVSRMFSDDPSSIMSAPASNSIRQASDARPESGAKVPPKPAVERRNIQ